MDIFPDWLGQYGSGGSNLPSIVGYRVVTGPVKDAKGQDLVEGTLRLKLLYPHVDGTAFVAPVEHDIPIVDGDFAVQLAAPGKYGFLVVDKYNETIWDFQSYLDEGDSEVSLAELYLSQEDTAHDYTSIPRTFVGLLDTPPSLEGGGGKLLVVGDDEEGVQVSPRILWGTGDPEGVVTADIGTMFIREDGSPGETLYLKESGNDTSSGWAAK